MSDQPKDGGPAFPQHVFTPMHPGGGQWTTVGGMTLRDWLAGQAMSGCYAGRAGVLLKLDPENLRADVERFYQIADAMLAAREAAQ